MNKKAAEALPRPLFYLILIGIFKKIFIFAILI